MGLIFSPELLPGVMSGAKTCTRRLARATDLFFGPHWTALSVGLAWVRLAPGGSLSGVLSVQRGARFLWVVGRTYAILPGRGRKAVGRLYLTGLRLEPVQSILAADVRSEGFLFLEDFMATWDALHGAGQRWQDNPLVWVLAFKRML